MHPGLYIFRNENLDFSILDIMMPVMDGWKLARHIRKSDAFMPGFFAARNQKVDRIKGLKRENILEELWGKNDYFLGCSMEVFVTRLRKYIKPDESISRDTIISMGLFLRVD